ncbi:hypothetical protein EA462_15135 [Natrarchaeobius halalkaliphilus]|uniref:Uncharacterized protein n=1 Tax=Natrarchaeobius halalkaliphilus TaxID=1679091 RepID=A0A3N6MRT0_9EURY|nr:hypothetical protein [Natrarchaeobius halalkaliphilus]RQG86983.1 hypothetical protein EA462_15135 [Natrarchaeobius halalkaliphilus]
MSVQQQRRVSLVVGAVFLLVFAWSLWISFEVLAAEPLSGTVAAMLAGGLAMVLGGLAFLVAGLRERVTVAGRTLEWWQLQSVGFVCLGLYMIVSGLAQDSLLSFYALLTAAAGIGFVAFGIQRLRNGLPEETEPSMRQVATVVVGTMVGFLLFTIVAIWLT